MSVLKNTKKVVSNIACFNFLTYRSLSFLLDKEIIRKD